MFDVQLGTSISKLIFGPKVLIVYRQAIMTRKHTQELMSTQESTTSNPSEGEAKIPTQQSSSRGRKTKKSK